MPKPSVFHTNVNRYERGSLTTTEDLLAVEEPLEIRIGYGFPNNRQQKRIAVTMRTPGNDFELALGFLYTEKIIQSFDQVISIKYCSDKNKTEELENVVRVELAHDVHFDAKSVKRNFYTTSSCGVCGKESIEAVKLACNPIQVSKNLKLTADYFLPLPDKLRNQQVVFAHTGGIHACALFDKNGNLLLMREDIGRHNALDKLIGAALAMTNNVFLDSVLLLSGRACFELIQKAALVGIPCICAVGAPSSLTVKTAQELNVTLIGFLRNERFNVYADNHQIVLNPGDKTI
jgi:FdhD protein